MSVLSIQPPYPIITDVDGQPLEDGYIYIGQTNLDPVANPINVFWDTALTVPATQPIRTLNGYPVNNGDPGRLYVNSDYSIRILDKRGSLVYSAPVETERYNNLVIDITLNNLTFTQSGVGAVDRTAMNKMREAFTPKDFGAAGDGITDDTAKIQSALNALPGGLSSTLLIINGDYLLSNASPGVFNYALNVLSNEIIKGSGGVLILNDMGYCALRSIEKSNIKIDGASITGVNHAGNDAASAAVRLTANDVDIWNNSIINSSLVDTSWGFLLTQEVGAGTARNTRVIGNEVRSSSANTMADGLHVVGRIINTVLSANSVMNRADAGFAVNMTATHNGYGFAVTGNASTNNLVGIDVSGGKYGVVVGNSCYNTIDHAASNPCIRAITYSGSDPSHIIIGNNLALGTHTASGEVDIKVTTNGADSFVHVNNNILKSFYTDARHVSIAHNYFMDSGSIVADNNSAEIHIGENIWDGSMSIFGQGNPGLAGKVFISRQNWKKDNAANFLPTYSAANPFWEAHFYLESDTVHVTSTAFTTNSAVNVDVTNAFLVLPYPCIVMGIVAVADCATHTGHLVITDLANVELAVVDFPVVAGVGGTDVMSSGLTFPVQALNPYKPKLAAGVYKLRARSDLNNLTVKNIAVAVWW